MDRIAILARHAPPDRPGIEIAPWVHPVVPRSGGWQSRTLDVFDRGRLVANAQAMGLGHLAHHIEEVDFVCDAADIGSLPLEGSRFAYVVSSHSFEHLPNPVKFLRGCAAVLEEGGHLSMAIPDKRCCLDYFRPVSTTADMLAAFFENRTRPTAAQVFSQTSLAATFLDDEGRHRYGFQLNDNLERLQPNRRLEEGFAAWRAALTEPDAPRTDTHCWTLTPATFALIVGDLRQLGLIAFKVVEIVAAQAPEFFVHLRLSRGAPLPPAAFYAKRASLLREMMRELAVNVSTNL